MIVTKDFMNWLEKNHMEGRVIKINELNGGDEIVEMRATPKAIVVNMYKNLSLGDFRAKARYRFARKDIVRAGNKFHQLCMMYEEG